MTSRQRVLTAIAHREPDRLPITFDAEPEVIAALERHFNVASADAVWDALHVDTRLVGVDHNYHHIAERDGVRYDFWGIGALPQQYSLGSYWEYCHHPLATMTTVAQIEGYDWPTAAEVSFESLRAARSRHPDKAIIAHITHGGYFKATHMRGMEQFMLDLAGQPKLAAAVIEHVSYYMTAALQRLCREAGDTFDIFYMADDFCAAEGPMISPAMFRDYVQPYLTRLAQIAHAHGKAFLLHVCGAVRPFIPALIAAGVDLLEPIQTSAVGMEVEGLKRDFGADLAFYGSIDLIRVLSRGTAAEVRNEVLKNFRVLGAGGGFIVGPGHTYIQPDVPLENILTMYETAFNECRY